MFILNHMPVMLQVKYEDMQIFEALKSREPGRWQG